MITVDEIAKIVAKERGLTDVRLEFSGGVNGGLGPIGGVKTMLPDTGRIKALG
jgi:hypothetical protein